jgi:hypothetical protein
MRGCGYLCPVCSSQSTNTHRANDSREQEAGTPGIGNRPFGYKSKHEILNLILQPLNWPRIFSKYHIFF